MLNYSLFKLSLPLGIDINQGIEYAIQMPLKYVTKINRASTAKPNLSRLERRYFYHIEKKFNLLFTSFN